MNKEINIDRKIICAACRYDDVILSDVMHFDMVMHSQISALKQEKVSS